MKTSLSIALACALAATSAAAQMKPKPQQKVMVPASSPNGAVQLTQAQSINSSLSAARRVTREEAAKLVKAGKAVYIDVRSKDSFDRGHIKGAYSMPNSQLIQRIRDIPPGKMLITYCACKAEETAAMAVNKLNAHGIKNSAALAGGWNEWIALGLPIEKTK